jgi:hypothetical protein
MKDRTGKRNGKVPLLIEDRIWRVFLRCERGAGGEFRRDESNWHSVSSTMPRRISKIQPG